VDFGEILNKWEQGHPASKDAMQKWLDKNPVCDKDANAKTAAIPGERRQRLMRIEPDDTIDLHGVTGEKAYLLLDRFFLNAKNSGYEKLRIIHGKGNRSRGEAVLGKTVRNFIEQCPFAGESGSEKASKGGTGATWVFLKD